MSKCIIMMLISTTRSDDTVHYEAAEDKLTINDDELSQEYFMSNEFEVQSAEEEILLEREYKERECNSTSDDLDSNAPIASLATKNSRNSPKTIFDRSKAVHPPIVGTIVKKKCVAWAKQRQITSMTRGR